MKKLFLLSILALASVNISIAQKLTWNPTQEIKGNERQWYAGEANGNTYFIYRGFYGKLVYQIVEFSNNLSTTKTFEIDLNGSKIEDVFISNNQIKIIYKIQEGDEKVSTTRFVVDSYDFNGEKKGEIIIYEEKDEKRPMWGKNSAGSVTKFDDYDSKTIENVVLSSNRKYIGIHYFTDRYHLNKKDKFILFETDNFKQMKTIDLNSQIGSHCVLLNNGDFISIEGDAKDCNSGEPLIDIKSPVVISIYNFKENSKKQIEISVKADEDQFNCGLFYKLSEDQKLFYVAINYGKYKPSKYNVNKSYQPSAGVQLSKINIEKGEVVETKLIPINQTIIEEIGSKKKGGIPFLKTFDIKEDAGGYYIFAQIRKVDIDDAEGFRSKTNFSYEDILIFREFKEGSSIQKSIKIKSQNWDEGFSSILYMGQLYFLYNDGIQPNTEINIIKFNNNLEVQNSIKEMTYKNHKIYLNVNEINVNGANQEHIEEPHIIPGNALHKISINKYILFGRMQNYVGSAILELN
jgi:hypothetical protein